MLKIRETVAAQIWINGCGDYDQMVTGPTVFQISYHLSDYPSKTPESSWEIDLTRRSNLVRPHERERERERESERECVT